MPKNFVLTLTGPDRIGIVDRMTGMLLERGGNVETSRMVRLGGEFAVLMLVSMPASQLAGLDEDLEGLTVEGYKVTTTTSEPADHPTHAGWRVYEIEVQGADNEGIIHEVAHYLSECGINIESVDSETSLAPVSGSPLFAMSARVAVPPGVSGGGWEAGLHDIGGRMNLEIRVSEVKDR